MGTYVLRRMLQTGIVLFLTSILVFGAIHLIPGDAITVVAGNTAGFTPEVMEALRHKWGLDRPVHEQYVIWLGRFLRGDMGVSYQSQSPVSTIIARKLPATLELAGAALLISMLVGIPGGIIAALKQNTVVDYVVTSFITLAMAVPSFWAGIMVVYLFAVELRWLPPGGYIPFIEAPGSNLKHLILPAGTLGLIISAYTMRVTRSSLLEEMRQDYVLTARSKGLAERAVVYGHVLKNALIPTVTILGVNLSFLLGGAVMIEYVFRWPGMGWAILDAIGSRDYYVLQAAVLLAAGAVVLVNLGTDILCAALDPRIGHARVSE